MRNSFHRYGDLGSHYLSVDWGATPVGAVSSWGPSLRGIVDVMLESRYPMMVAWGADLVLLYNQAYVELIRDKHPEALGRPAREVFPEAWHLIGEWFDQVRTGGEAIWFEDAPVPLTRRGFLEECYWTFCYSPVHGDGGDGGDVGGVLVVSAETTGAVLARRRLELLGRLHQALADADDVDQVAGRALPILRNCPADFPVVDISGELRVYRGRQVVLPLGRAESHAPYLEVSLSPMLAADQPYLDYLELVAASIRQALDRVQVRTSERRLVKVQTSMSAALQRSLLPRPATSGRTQVAVRYQAATELAQIGGDWYDLFELPDKSLTVVVGDVTGHDQESAAAMAQVRNMARGVAYTMAPAGPGTVLTGLDRAMTGTAEDLVASAVLAQLTDDGSHLTMSWSNAGHPPPVLVEPDGTARLLEVEPNLLLGIDGDTDRYDDSVTLLPGSTVVLYTDGLVERRDASIAEGLEWLLGLLAGAHALSVDQVCDHLLASAVAVEDDIALLVLRA